MDLKNLSEIVKNEREKKGINFEKIYQDTKVPIKFLKYIEEGNWDNFPSEAHKKAILKKYLEYLKIEVDIENLFDEKDEIKDDETKREKYEKPLIKEKNLKGVVFILFVLFLILFFITLYYLGILSK